MESLKERVLNKYLQNGKNGYVRIALPFEEDKKINQIQRIISNDDLFYKYFYSCYKKEKEYEESNNNE